MEESLVKIVKYLVRHRGVDFSEARRRMFRQGLSRRQVDRGLEWLLTVAGPRGAAELGRGERPRPAVGSWAFFSRELNLTRRAYGFLLGLCSLGVIDEQKMQRVLGHAFHSAAEVDMEELQDILWCEAYAEVVAGEGVIFIEELGWWGKKN